jgi:hypothetical protein
MMRALLFLLTTIAALVLIPSTANAADPIVTDLRVEGPDTVTVGDRVRYTVTIQADDGANVVLAPSGLPPEVSLIATPRSERRSIGNGRTEVTLTFELAPFVPGEIVLPNLLLRYQQPDGTSGVLQGPASRIQVTSVLPSNGQVAPRDLKPQASIGQPPPAWITPAIAGAVVALILLIVLLLWRRAMLRRRNLYEPEPEIIGLGPEDRARRLLDRAGVAFAADGDYVAYYSTIAVTIRNYLTERFGFPAFALTTRELQEEMLRRGLDRWQIRVAGGLLSQCDAVVYAYYRPAAERADADLTAAYEVVEMSRPEPVLAEEEVAVS